MKGWEVIRVPHDMKLASVGLETYHCLLWRLSWDL